MHGAFPPVRQGFRGKAFGCASAYLAGQHRGGVALWLPPGVEADDDQVMPILHETASPGILDDVLPLMAQMGAHHPTEPHWYLPLIGVDPACQNQGLGAALMRPVLEICDLQGQVAYVESTNPRSIGLYERHGFTVLARLQGGSSPPIFTLLRRPRQPD